MQPPPDPIAVLLELQILLSGPHGTRIINRAQILLMKELRTTTVAPHEQDSIALAAVLLAAEQHEILKEYNLPRSLDVAPWVPKAVELLFEAARTFQEEIYR